MAIERFLVLDEEEPNLLFFEMLLGELGFSGVATSRSGNEALQLIDEKHIQFVIVAWEMSIIPGTVFMQKVRSQRRRRYLPYLIYSKRMNDEDVRLTKELGLTNIISLPFNKAAIAEKVREIIETEAKLPQEEILLRKIEGYLAEMKPNEALKLFDPRFKKKENPFFVKAQTAHGETWLLSGQMENAKEALDAALAVDPEYVPALNILAKVYSRMGKHEESIAILERLTQQSPKNISSLLNLGAVYVDADRHEDAKKVFEKVTELDADNAALKDERGRLAFKEGDMHLAAQLLAETESGEMLAKSFNNMAIALVHKQEYTRAIETYENAMRLLADKAKLHLLQYNLGLALSKKGDLAKAFVELAKSYKSEPSFEKSYAALAKLGKKMKELGQAYDVALARECNRLRKEWLEKQANIEDGKPKNSAA